MNQLTTPDLLPDLLTLVVTVEEIRMTLGPSEEHWRKASFMSWKELPESFDAAFGDEDITAFNAIRLRDMVRRMYKEKRRLQKFEEPYTDYMTGETGIGKTVRRSITIAIKYQGDAHFSLPQEPATNIERGVNRRPAANAEKKQRPEPVLPALFNSLCSLTRRWSSGGA